LSNNEIWLAANEWSFTKLTVKEIDKLKFVGNQKFWKETK
jgi:hypothetical protein